MITINKKIKISKASKKIEFDVDDLPEGEYDVQLVINENNKLIKKIDFGSWVSDIDIPAHMTFSREEIYGDDGR